jgi:integrase
MVRLCRESADLGWLANVLTALACTGLRISELASLRRSDVDKDKNLITLTDESTRGRREAGQQARRTKSGRSRFFPIHGDLLEVLNGLTPATDGLVFHGPRGGRLKPDTLRQVLIREVLAPLQEQFVTPQGESGFADGRLHSFRHFFCSACASSGVPEQVVMEWLGHSESKMVRHYFNLHDDESQRQMRRLNFVQKAGDGVVAGNVSQP